MIKGAAKVFKGQSGQALIGVLMLLMVGMLVTTPYLVYSSALNKRVRVSEKNLYGFYAMDAGVEYGMWRLKYAGMPYYGDLPEDVNGKQTSITTDPDPAAPIPPVGTDYWVIDSNSYLSGQKIFEVKAHVTRVDSNPNPLVVDYDITINPEDPGDGLPDGWEQILPPP